MMNKINPKILLTLSVLLAAIVCPTAAAKIIYVDANATGANNGLSWDEAYNYLQDALADADSSIKPVEIRVAQGIYKPDQGGGQIPGDRNAIFQLINDVAIYGGFPSGGGTWNERNPIDPNHKTILSGDIGMQGDNSDNSYHVVISIETNATAILEGFTVTSAKGGQAGGGMFNRNSSPKITHCVFISNTVNDYGGGMYNEGSSPTLTDCTFINNKSISHGGGMYNLDSSPIVTDSNFSDNDASYGGALFNWSSGPNVVSCSFKTNTARGGAVYNYDHSYPNFSYCIFNNNSGDYAGAVFNVDSNSTFYHCNFNNNNASESGGAMYNTRGSPLMESCAFQGNRAKEYGGAVYNWDNSPLFNNCIFIENDATRWYGMTCGVGNGGAMYNSNSSPTLTDCTFIANYSCYDGGGMRNYNNSNPFLENCLFSENWNSEGSGGGMSNKESCSPTLINCAFIDNEAGSQGGGICSWSDCNVVLVDCMFQRNHACNYGGGIHSQHDSIAHVINCIFIHNSTGCTGWLSGGGAVGNCIGSHLQMANCLIFKNCSGGMGGAAGGGLLVRDDEISPSSKGSATVTNCTFVANWSLEGSAGGVYNDGGSGSTLELANSILWGNYEIDWDPNWISKTYRYDETAQITGFNIVINHTCVQNWTGLRGGIGNTGQNPLFVHDPNDPNATWVDGDYHLLPNSPCIDAGDNSEPNLGATDLDGHPRIIDGDCNDTNVVDMGAYEFNYAYIGDFDYNCSVDFFDFSMFALTWFTEPADEQWNPFCNIGIPADSCIDWRDVAILCCNWLAGIEP